MSGAAAKARRIELVRRHLVALGIVLGVSTLMALVGAFQTYELGGFVTRLGYWLVAIVPGYLIFAPAVEGAKWATERLNLPFWSLLLPGNLIACLPMTLIVWYLGMRMDRPPSSAEFASLFGNVAIVALVIAAVFWWRGRGDDSARLAEGAAAASVASSGRGGKAVVSTSASISANDPPEFVKRLPANFGPVRALESEDHYVRVHGVGRSELILMRLADAVAEMAGADGLQVHRSWWVAIDAVVSARRQGRQAVLLLADGAEVPVSRANMAAARAAGLLRGT